MTSSGQLWANGLFGEIICQSRQVRHLNSKGATNFFTLFINQKWHDKTISSTPAKWGTSMPVCALSFKASAQSVFQLNSIAVKCALIFAAAFFSNSARAQNLTCTNNWLGNSGGLNSNFVREEIHNMRVSPEGTSCTASLWDEAHHQIVDLQTFACYIIL